MMLKILVINKSNKLVQTTALPTVCGVVGAVTLGPLGAMAGAKIGGFATVLATTGGITGLITGYKVRYEFFSS